MVQQVPVVVREQLGRFVGCHASALAQRPSRDPAIASFFLSHDVAPKSQPSPSRVALSSPCIAWAACLSSYVFGCSFELRALHCFVFAVLSPDMASRLAKVVAQTAAAAAPPPSLLQSRVAAARLKLFGQVEGGGQRSGRKISRRALKGETLDSWYPYTMKELKAPGSVSTARGTLRRGRARPFAGRACVHSLFLYSALRCLSLSYSHGILTSRQAACAAGAASCIGLFWRVLSPLSCLHARHRYEEPAIEDLYRYEQELNRVGKTRAEGKVLPLRANVVDRIKVADFNMEIVNWDRLEGDEDTPEEEEAPKILPVELQGV